MSIVRSVEESEYYPDYGTLVVRDQWIGPLVPESRELFSEDGALSELANTDLVIGAQVIAGEGWLHGSSGDGYHRVRLELHDGPPASSGGGWERVVETPYRSATGVVQLTSLIDDEFSPTHLELRGPGSYRVRVHERTDPASEDDSQDWLIMFWRTQEDELPPRWVHRAPEPEREHADHRDGWSEVIGWGPLNVLEAIQEVAGDSPVSMADLGLKLARTFRGSGWLDEPVSVDIAPPLTTGHPESDRYAHKLHQDQIAARREEQQERERVARRFGLPGPQVQRDFIPLLVSAGLLQDCGNGTLRVSSPRPSAVPLMANGAEWEREQRQEEARTRLQMPVAEVVAYLLWAGGDHATSAERLAAELLLPVSSVGDALVSLGRTGRLAVPDPLEPDVMLRLSLVLKNSDRIYDPDVQEGHYDPDLFDDGDAQDGSIGTNGLAGLHGLTLQASVDAFSGIIDLDGPPPDWNPDEPGYASPEEWWASLPGTATFVGGEDFGEFAGATAPTPFGRPPVAGLVTGSGELVSWESGEARVLATFLGEAPQEAFACPFGVVVMCALGGYLVRPWGASEPLARKGYYVNAELSDDGRYLAVLDYHYGTVDGYRLGVVDLATGSREYLPSPETTEISLYGWCDGAVHFRTGSEFEDPEPEMRWHPGAPAAVAPTAFSQVKPDPVDGSLLVADDLRTGVTVVRENGERVHAAVDPEVSLALGGQALFRMNGHPAVLTVFDLPAQGEAAVIPRVIRFPDDFDLGYLRSDRAVWDAPNQILLPGRASHSDQVESPGIRVDLATGLVERLPEVRGGSEGAVLVRPWIAPRG